MSELIILPGDPLFAHTLNTALPPDWKQVAASNSQMGFIVRADGSGLLEAVNRADFNEYAYGGEYDERLFELVDEEEEDILADGDNYG